MRSVDLCSSEALGITVRLSPQRAAKAHGGKLKENRSPLSTTTYSATVLAASLTRLSAMTMIWCLSLLLTTVDANETSTAKMQPFDGHVCARTGAVDGKAGRSRATWLRPVLRRGLGACRTPLRYLDAASKANVAVGAKRPSSAGEIDRNPAKKRHLLLQSACPLMSPFQLSL